MCVCVPGGKRETDFRECGFEAEIVYIFGLSKTI